MIRAEAYAARIGASLLAVALLAIGKRISGGGSATVTVAQLCLVCSLLAFGLAWQWSWKAREAVALFPIADYGDLWEDEILPLLIELEPDELDVVRRFEASHAGRRGILDEIDALRARPSLNPGWIRR